MSRLMMFWARGESLSLGKAAELSDVSKFRFMEMLKEHGLPFYEYNEQDFTRDKDVMVKYREETVK